MLCLAAACGAPPEETIDVGAHGLRLAAVAQHALVRGPLAEIRGIDDPLHRPDIPRDTVLLETFDDFEQERLGWPEDAGGSVEREGDNSFFVVRDLAPGTLFGINMDARPHRHYVLSRRIRSDRPVDLDFCVLERPRPLQLDRSSTARNLIAGYRDSLKVHWFEPPEPDGEWHEDKFSFFSTSETTTLTLLIRTIRSTHSPAAKRREIAFDDIALHELQPDDEQAVALLKTRDNVGGSHLEGLVKRGQFPPMWGIPGPRTPVDGSFAVRTALYSPAPGEIEFALRVPARASLRFAATLARESTPASRARFSVVVRHAGTEHLVWSDTVSATGEDWLWHEHRVALDQWADEPIGLVLRTEGEQGVPQPLWGTPEIAVPAAGDTPHNVILIAIDTLRADRLRCYGFRRESSPHIDALAADGVRFEQTAANANWTCPSFASIFTGLTPSRHGVFDWGATAPLPQRLDTIAEQFQRAGFSTSAIIYKAPLYDAGYDQGFDVFFNVPRPYQVGSENLAEALAWLQRHRDRRNFLFLHFNDPHQPFTQPQPFDKHFGANPEASGVQLPHFVDPRRDRHRARLMRLLYAGAVAYVDDCVGHFLQALRDADLYEDAAIALVSDHGEALWEHGHFGHGQLLLRDSVVRVPLLVKSHRPDRARGVVVPDQVVAFDIMPTLLELAGLPVEAGLDARSLVPLLAANAAPQPPRIAVVETSANGLAARTPQWKYVLHTPGTERLYDLAADPDEATDVLDEQPRAAARLRHHVLDHVLRHRPGRYLAVLAGEQPIDPVELTDVERVAVLFGQDRTADGGDRLQIAPPHGSGVDTIYRIRAEASPRATRDGRSRRLRAALYTPGRLQELIEAGAGGAYVFDGPPPHDVEARRARSLDLQLTDAMRALGYVGGK